MIFPKIETVINSLDIATISQERKLVLNPLITYIRFKVKSDQNTQLNFICTHNSRRSIFSQVWAQAIASYFQPEKKIFCFSGGTETTALFPMVIETLKHSGFQIEVISEGNNPIYDIKFSDNESPINGFSKIYNSEINPISHFAAILTCSDAHENCPFIEGTEIRIPITYEDPKFADGKAEQETFYKETSLNIATELKYVFSNI